MFGKIKVPPSYRIFLLNIAFYQIVTGLSQTIKEETEYNIVHPYRSTASGENIYPITGSKELQNQRITWTGSPTGALYYTLEADDKILVMNVTQNSRMDVEISSDMDDYIKSLIQRDCLMTGSIVGEPESKVVINNCDAGLLNGWICGETFDFYLHGNAEDGLHKLYRVDKSWNVLKNTAAIPRSVCHRQRTRNRRSTAMEKKIFIELAMLVDYSMQKLYGDGIEEYLIKMMKITAESFRHPSLKFNVELVISKIVYLDKHNSTLMIDMSSPTRSRRNVGHYMYELNNLDDTNPDHFDAAVFLTRNNFGPKGFAKTGGMCNLQENTVLVKDEGYKSAYVIAHELGHLFNMEHDGEGNSCYGDVLKQSVMSAEVMSTYNTHVWSKCSNVQIEVFISSPDGWCLQDEPFDDKVIHLPGETYPGIGITLNEQCKVLFDSPYAKCNTFFSDANLCSMLWCTKENNPYSCSQKEIPPLDGTPCGKNKMCKDGKCIKAPKMPKIQVVDGGWTDWGDFSDCSLSCGVGISSRERKCTNPVPKNGGKYCEGKNMEHRTCNVQKCPGKNTDLRAELCKEENQVLIPAEAYKDSERCLLTCVSKTSMSGRILTLDSVPDGTPCSYDEPSSICLHGACMQLGCDNVLGSNAKVDRCGVCHGTNVSCVQTKEKFKKKMNKDVYVIANIPEGARHFQVIEKTKTGHNLVLRNVDTDENVIDTRSLTWQTNSAKSIISAGIKFTLGFKKNGLKIITSSPGPLLNKMSLKVYRNKTDSKTPVFTYSYVTEDERETETQYLGAKRAKMVTNIIKPLYDWVKDGFSECSATCGGGLKTEIYKCKRMDNMKVVNERKCTTKAPNTKVSCAEKACKTYSWDASAWSECSKSCGQGEKKRTLKCIRIVNGQTKIMKHKFCIATFPRPKTIDKCNIRTC